ncbi:Alpha/Beta hydrolase protein [Diaporthe sp. PMI_573]|nr:Alpha/Beta hydrolase protein [Diaporthaceae sp. PMI_573]
MLWIFGGGFELGSTAMYDGSNVVARSVELGKPVVFAPVNYRVGGFGFLGGKEVLAEGSANLGLLDQRLGMQWVADNIASFGGAPEKVTLWGESAGAISIFDQLVANNGDVTYKGKPLFRGAIMNSGSAVPTDPVDSAKAQQVYDAVVQGVGCAGEADTLNCLRQAEYEELLKSMNSVPGILSFNALALSYLPRPDGKFLVASPEALATSGNLPQVPFILGDQKDEGTLFGLFTTNLTTTDDFKDYLKTLYFTNTDPQIVDQFVDIYPEDPAQGSPFDTGDDNNIYPQFKRVAALLGDAVFTMSRRVVLNITTGIQPGVKRWSYLSQYDQGTRVLGTFHGSDLIQVFYGIKDNFAASAIVNYFLNFAYNLDPNDASGGTRATDGEQLINWPDWASSNQLIQFDADKASLIPDDFRQQHFEFLLQNSANLHF